MKSGGMKFSLHKGLVTISVLSCVAGVLCIGTLSADEDSQAVRFKLTDDGDSGKVIVIEKSPDHRDAKRVFDNGLRFKRDADGNIYRIGDFKEVEPTPIRKPAQEVTPSANQVPAVAKDEETLKETNTTEASLPELPSLETLFPNLNWSGLEEAFEGIVVDAGSTPRRESNPPGLKIKAKPQAVAVLPETKTELDSQEKSALPESEPIAQEKSAIKEAAEPEVVAEADGPVKEKPDVVEEKKEVDSLTGLPMLADFELSDLGLPKLELLDLNLFFGTKSEPLVNSQGEVPEEIEGQAEVEEPMEDSIEEMPPIESREEDVAVEAEAEVVLKAKAESKPASNTSIFELPSIDLGLAELFGVTTEDKKETVISEPRGETAVGSEAVKSVDSSLHRAPGRKSLGANQHRATKTGGTTGNGFDLFSEFVIPEFNNPFGFGKDDDEPAPSVQKPVRVPALKNPVVPSPDAAILDSLPKLDSDRPSVPGLKLMRSKAPSHVPMVDDEKVASEKTTAEEDMELGSGISPTAELNDAEKDLVDPDKILDTYKK